MKPSLALVVALLTLSCGGALKGGTIGGGAGLPTPLPTSSAFDLVPCRDAVVDNYCNGMAGVTFTITPLGVANPPRVQLGDAGTGYVFVPAIPSSWTLVSVAIAAPGYVPFTINAQTADLVKENAAGRHNFFGLTSAHVDPSALSLDELKGRLRGSLSVRLNLPYGSRPGQDSNIAWMPFYELYQAPDRARMRDAYRSRGLTMTAIGPVTGNDCYHEQFPNIGDPPTGGLLAGCLHNWRLPTQAEWDAYLDGVQEQWDAGLMPCYFAKPDGWERTEYAADVAALEQLYVQPRARRLLRCVVGPGWEPSGTRYGWPNSEYVKWVQWGARIFPNAIRGIHLISDLDAPTGGDDDRTFPAGQGNALSWVNVAPFIHFFADQVGGYVGGETEQPSAEFLSELCKHVKRVGDGFRGQYDWPSAGADGTRLLHILFEYAAFADWWKNFAEKYSWQIGDAAIACGADGYGDGGRVAVPVR